MEDGSSLDDRKWRPTHHNVALALFQIAENKDK